MFHHRDHFGFSTNVGSEMLSFWVIAIFQICFLDTLYLCFIFMIKTLKNICVFQIVTKKFKYFLFGMYINVYLKVKTILYNEVTTLVEENNAVKKFRIADKKDIVQFDDVCAICLGDMKSARETKCHHLFHDHCLSLALKSSEYCPTCKSPL